MLRRTLLAGACIAAAGCGGGGDAEAPVVASTTQLKDLAAQVAGQRVPVRGLLGPNSDPHGYEPRPSDVRALEGATVILRSGGDVDEWLPELADSAGAGARPVDVGASVGAAGGDPHWWQDPLAARRAVTVIERALTRADPAGRSAYTRNARRLRARLTRLHREVGGCVARVPRSQRVLVTTHDALGRFARRYGLTVVGALIPSRSTQAQPSSGDTARLVGQIRRRRVRAIFPERSLSPKLEQAVARETGAKVGDALWADSLGPAGSSGATYVESIASNTAAIVAGLSGGRVACRPSV
jgi:ABC-type Zn uptake system ZnuABC Zn-binding protein ZnuA